MLIFMLLGLICTPIGMLVSKIKESNGKRKKKQDS
jgi:hypothetical protein